MLRLQDNFTDSISLLRSEKRQRSDINQTTDIFLENQFWIFLYNLGFTKLNVGRECEVYFGKDEKCIESKKVDIVAESKEARLYVECSTQASTTTKIKNWIADVNAIRKYEKINKNFAFIYYTDKLPSQTDKQKLKRSGIQLITQKTREYIEDLRKLYRNLAYFQFLGFVFAGKEIRYLEKEEFKVPAIRVKYTSKQKCYLFGIHPSRLIPLASVLHRKMDIEGNILGNYQRLVKKQKISSIKQFIKEQGGVFPTNIIISFDAKGNYFKPKGSRISDIEFGEFELPREFHSITIIDGQHRLFAYDGLEESENHLIYVIAFERMPIDQQIQTFVDINEKQTKVSSSLMWDLYTSILEDSDIRSQISQIAKHLNEKDESNALYGAISYDSAPYSNKGSKITLESFCTALKSSQIINPKKEGVYITLDIKTAEKLLKEYFNVIFSLAPEHWNRKDRTLNLLRSNQGIGALIKLFDDVIRYIHKKDFEALNISENYKKELIPLIEPIIRLVEGLKTKESIKEFKRVGEGGKVEIYKDFVKCINQAINDFGLDIIEEQESLEFDDLLRILKEDDENFSIEAKEAFFTDCKRLKKGDGKLSQNTEEAIKDILKTIAAFANYKGGQILLGVEDRTWDIIGLDYTDLKLKNNYDTLKNAITQKIKSEIGSIAVTPEIKKYCKSDRTLAVIKVKQNPKEMFEKRRLAYLKKDNNIYIRDNANTEVLSVEQIEDYVSMMLKELETSETED